MAELGCEAEGGVVSKLLTSDCNGEPLAAKQEPSGHQLAQDLTAGRLKKNSGEYGSSRGMP